jgi:hypothetical protein
MPWLRDFHGCYKPWVVTWSAIVCFSKNHTKIRFAYNYTRQGAPGIFFVGNIYEDKYFFDLWRKIMILW